LLHNLRHQLLGYCLSKSDLPRFYWYVPSPPQANGNNSANPIGAATGIALVYFQATEPDCSSWTPGTAKLGIGYFSVTVSLNVLLTLMIVLRLLLHSRLVRDAMGPITRPSGIYNAVVSMLVESSTLYAVTFILFIGTWATMSPAAFIFFPILAQTQVRVVFAFQFPGVQQSVL
jgi:hypothetical protein